MTKISLPKFTPKTKQLAIICLTIAFVTLIIAAASTDALDDLFQLLLLKLK